MKDKINNLYIGLVIGLVLPLISLLLLYIFKYESYTFNGFINLLKQFHILTQVLSLSVLPNLMAFFIFIWLNMLKAARGVLMATFIGAFIIFGLKLIV
ncbi:MAG: hypothetical protein GXO79_15735 [Chlorobi bacterium]|nr:hypothetical protein [Chlorobiota bacterium]